MEHTEFYKQARERFFIKVSSFDNNKNRMMSIPYKCIENIAVTYHIMIKEDCDSMTSIVVTNSILDKLGIDKEKLHDAAVENSMRLFPVYVDNIKNIIYRIAEKNSIGEFESDISEKISDSINEEDGYALFVVTNKTAVHGAAAIFYPGVLDKIGESLGVNYFVLPSSVHEMIIVPDNGQFEYIFLKRIVESINKEIVNPKDRLTDDVYYYNFRKHSFKNLNIL